MITYKTYIEGTTEKVFFMDLQVYAYKRCYFNMKIFQLHSLLYADYK